MPRGIVREGACGAEAGRTCACLLAPEHTEAHRCACGGSWLGERPPVRVVTQPFAPAIAGWGEAA